MNRGILNFFCEFEIQSKKLVLLSFDKNALKKAQAIQEDKPFLMRFFCLKKFLCCFRKEHIFDDKFHKKAQEFESLNAQCKRAMSVRH